MSNSHPTESQITKISIHALGGQGGGTLANWIVEVAELSGYQAQYTSVPGVAQRTGATVYYLELYPRTMLINQKTEPVLALMPVAGDVDIVIASEIMEAGRAITRGLVSAQTTLIASSHRVYAIDEKTERADGRADTDKIYENAKALTDNIQISDMQDAANQCGCIISAVMFGMLAASKKLPFSIANYKHVIAKSDRAVDSNLAGFEHGLNLTETVTVNTNIQPAAEKQKLPKVLQKLIDTLPLELHETAGHGVRLCADYQDIKYAKTYLARLEDIIALDETKYLSQQVAKYLALWMCGEDLIRVSDLKVRAGRFAHIREEYGVQAGQVYSVSEFFHPRLEEVLDILPYPFSKLIYKGKSLKTFLNLFFKKGRRINSNRLFGFLLLYVLSSLRFIRRVSYKFQNENMEIVIWLDKLKDLSQKNYALASAVASLPVLLKGYGDTYENGKTQFRLLFDGLAVIDSSEEFIRLRDYALEKNSATSLALEIERLKEKSNV